MICFVTSMFLESYSGVNAKLFVKLFYDMHNKCLVTVKCNVKVQQKLLVLCFFRYKIYNNPS